MTIKDIAKALGVSTSTVSKALNNATDISAGTKKKILDYAATTGFSLHKKKPTSKRLCVYFEDVDYTSSAHIGYQVLSGFKAAAEKHGYEIVVKSTSKGEPGALHFEDEMRANSFLGAFIIGTNLKSDLLKQLQDTAYPTILMDNFVDNPNVAYIGVDNIHTVSRLVDYLYRLGHRRIGILTGERESIVSQERLAGYYCGLTAKDLPVDPSLVVFGDFTEECGERFVETFLHQNATAVVAASDFMAIGLIKALKRLGVRVPEDVSVTGFDDLEVGRYFSPNLTTIHQDFVLTGSNAFSLLRQLIKGYTPERILLSGRLILRESAGKAGQTEQ